MNEEFYPFIAFFLIILGWIFYLNLGNKYTNNQKFFKKGQNFKDDFGEYFVEDIKKLVKHVEMLPKKNQINIYEYVLAELGRYTKETAKLSSPRKADKVYKKHLLDAGKLRRKNTDFDLTYKNPKWLSVTIFESLLRSESNKMSFNNGAKIRKYLFLKMKNLIPNNHNLKIFLRINNIK
jgi:hypothetical protein